MVKKKSAQSTEMAGKQFDVSYYEGETQMEKGLAETHEQVSDDYYEGTIDQQVQGDE